MCHCSNYLFLLHNCEFVVCFSHRHKQTSGEVNPGPAEEKSAAATIPAGRLFNNQIDQLFYFFIPFRWL